uniref:Secreted protein n=1 Tax=Anisakis simplex TaxID=6269 RepID=A0A0M3KKE8_ANISI
LCKTLACQACAKLMIDRLKAIGFLRWNTQLSINVPYSVDTRLCRRLRFSQPHRVSVSLQFDQSARTSFCATVPNSTETFTNIPQFP